MDDIWQHAERHLTDERAKIVAELRRIDAELAILPKIRLHLGLQHVTSSQVERWLAKYAEPAKTKRATLPRHTSEETRAVLRVSSKKAAAKRNLHTHEGETLSLGQWAEKRGMNRETIRLRLKAGWSLGDALDTPVGSQGQRSHRPKQRQLEPGKGTR